MRNPHSSLLMVIIKSCKLYFIVFLFVRMLYLFSVKRYNYCCLHVLCVVTMIAVYFV